MGVKLGDENNPVYKWGDAKIRRGLRNMALRRMIPKGYFHPLRMKNVSITARDKLLIAECHAIRAKLLIRKWKRRPYFRNDYEINSYGKSTNEILQQWRKRAIRDATLILHIFQDHSRFLDFLEVTYRPQEIINIIDRLKNAAMYKLFIKLSQKVVDNDEIANEIHENLSTQGSINLKKLKLILNSPELTPLWKKNHSPVVHDMLRTKEFARVVLKLTESATVDFTNELEELRRTSERFLATSKNMNPETDLEPPSCESARPS